MKRVMCIAGLAAASFIGSVEPARADWYDVLEAISGPGPSRHNPKVFSHEALSVCPKGRTPFGRSDELSFTVPCFYFDFASYRAERTPKKPYDDVDTQTYDFGISFQLRRPFELAVGGGFIHFESAGVDTYVPMIVPVRVAVRPLFFFPKLRGKVWPGFWKMEVREIIIPSKLTGDMFGSTADYFTEKHDYLTSFSLAVIDIGPLLDLLKPR